jgi:hypothetical protein
MPPRRVTPGWRRTTPNAVSHRGVWIGSGMDGIDGLTAGDPVTAEQMRALFGCGLHPLAELRQQQLEGPDLTLRDFQNATRLGAPFKIVDNDLIPFRLEVAKRIAALNTAIGSPADASIAAADRARVRTEVAREFFLTSVVLRRHPVGEGDGEGVQGRLPPHGPSCLSGAFGSRDRVTRYRHFMAACSVGSAHGP